ncbi:EpsG family protein [Parabacteroides sp. APC149_11_2_Y6]
MIIPAYLLFILVSFFSLVGREKIVYNRYIYVLFALILILFAGLRIGDAFPDYITYVDYYYRIVTGDIVFVEYSFFLIAHAVNFLTGNVIYLFLIYAIIGVSIKLYAIKQLSHLVFLSIVLYIANIYIVQELIQIRSGIASGILLLCIKPIFDKNLRKFLFLVLIAVFFHTSAIMILPLWFLNSRKINVYFWAVLIPIGYLIAFSKITLLTFIPVPFIQEKLDIYLSYKEYGQDGFNNINIFNVLFLFKCILAYIMLIYRNNIFCYNKYSILLLKIYLLSLFCFVGMSSIATVAFRMQGFYEVVEIILIPYMIYIFKPLYISKFIPVIISLFILTVLIFNSHLIFF